MPAKQAAAALANKMARIAWAVLTKNTVYRAPAAAVPLPPGDAGLSPAQAA